MTETDNETRAEWARQTLEHFRSLTNCDPGDAACDLIANIGHLIDEDKEYGPSLQAVIDRGLMHYEAEKNEDE